MTPNEKLIERLRAMGVHLPEGTTLRRTYSGRCMRAQGAWSWFTLYPAPEPGLREVGSHYTVTMLLKQKRLIVTRSETGDLEVDPWALVHANNIVAQEYDCDVPVVELPPLSAVILGNDLWTIAHLADRSAVPGMPLMWLTRDGIPVAAVIPAEDFHDPVLCCCQHCTHDSNCRD
jgi:hypothetical protein